MRQLLEEMATGQASDERHAEGEREVVRALKSNREPIEKSYEALIDGTMNVRAYSQREAVEEVKKFMKRSGIRPHDNHVQVFLKRQPKLVVADTDEGDWSKEAL
jgi:hypothetical protein